jgi:hypothetical protein
LSQVLSTLCPAAPGANPSPQILPTRRMRGRLPSALLIIVRFTLGAFGQVVIFAIPAGREIHGITGTLIAVLPVPLVKETIDSLRPRMEFEAWRAAAGGRSTR